jgi:hypothetical protein
MISPVIVLLTSILMYSSTDIVTDGKPHVLDSHSAVRGQQHEQGVWQEEEPLTLEESEYKRDFPGGN